MRLVRVGASLGLVFLLISCGGLTRAALRPKKAFSRHDSPSVPDYPDYRQARYWAALPEKADAADVLFEGAEDKQAAAFVDVFYVHPTTYFSRASWNAPLDDAVLNKRSDETAIRNQASVFNSVGRVFAPRYRQATLWSFMDKGASGDQALELAYQDVAAAFRQFLAERNQNRPIILAGHSQGAYHAYRLLVEFVANKPLGKRLVAAYLIGIPLPADVFTRTLPGLSLCQTPEQTGCVVNYNTITAGADTARFRRRVPIWYPEGYESTATKTLSCVNPISFRTDGAKAPAAQHKGAARFVDDEKITKPDRQLLWAQCQDGLLVIPRPPRRKYRLLLSRRGDYHMVDVSLFYLDLRDNAEKRAQAFSAQTR